MVNDACAVLESPSLHTIDISAALYDQFTQGDLAADNRRMLARSFDLKSAYRQMFLAEPERRHAFLSVFCPIDRTYKFFQSVALPFGSVQSVYSFLRISRAIWFLGATQLSLPWTLFFDDFLCYSDSVLAGNTEVSVQLLFKLLGWRIAETGDKAKGLDTSLNELSRCHHRSSQFLPQRGVDRQRAGPKSRAVESDHLSVEEWQP